MMKNTLNVRNAAQKVLLDSELKGQISDGMWENLAVRDHWQPWCAAEVVVNPGNLGRNFYAPYDSYNFVASSLLEVVGERMLAAVRKETGNPFYTDEEMLADLRDLKKIKKMRSAHPFTTLA